MSKLAIDPPYIPSEHSYEFLHKNYSSYKLILSYNNSLAYIKLKYKLLVVSY